MKLTKSSIEIAVREPRWQSFRMSLKGNPTTQKLKQLKAYLTTRNNSRVAQIQVRNYINALKRAGQIK